MTPFHSLHPDFSAYRARRGPLTVLFVIVAAAWFYFAAVIYAKNYYGVYDPAILAWGLPGAPLLAGGLVAGVGGFVLPQVGQIDRRTWLALLAASLGLAALLAWLFPPPWPAFSQPHTLRLVAAGTANPAARGAAIELVGLRTLTGRPIPLEQFQLAGDWRLEGGRLVSAGEEPGAAAVLQGNIPSGVELRFAYTKKSGTLAVEWDGQSQPVDLYSSWSVEGNTVMYTSPWAGGLAAQKGLLVLGTGLYFIALAALILLSALVFELHLLPAWLERAVLVTFYLAIFLFYAGLKRSYANFNTERVNGDTITYVRTAEIPLGSVHFWVSDRTFTLPLVYKLNGVTSANFTQDGVMSRVGSFQAWLSIACWTVLGLAAAGSLHKRWLRPAAFAVVLFFSLSLEVSLWDRLMWSEAVSFSLFALLLAFWIGLEQLPRRAGWPGYLYLLAMLLVTVLFSFTRDTNLYLVLSGAGLFVLAAIFKRAPAESRRLYILYALAVLALFIFQNMTVRLGNRWQVHIFDSLARRITLDERALDYFAAAGLPVSPAVRNLPNMGVAEYQGALMVSDIPEFKAVREWVNRDGQATYLRYLLAFPDKSLLEPLRNYARLINGNNREYIYPVYPGQPVPEVILANDGKFYPRSYVLLALGLALALAGIGRYWLRREPGWPAWLALSVLVLSAVPLSLVIWNGNPLEIERHTVQVGIQFRLAAWLALLLWADWLGSTLRVDPKNG